MLELYHHNTSVCSAKVRFALAEKRLEWRGSYIDLKLGDHLKPDYLKLNPNGVVPTLIHDGKVIIESTLINEYLDDAFPELPLRPKDPYARVQMRLWTKQLDEEIHPATGLLTRAIAFRLRQNAMDLARRTVDPKKREKVVEVVEKGLDSHLFWDSLRRFQKMLKDMDAALDPGPWLCGSEFSLADIGYAPYVTRLDHLCLQSMWDRLPRLAGWYERIRARPAYQEAIAGWMQYDGGGGLREMQEKGAENWPRVEAILKQLS